MHLKNYPTFDDLESRLKDFIDEVNDELKEEYLEEAEDLINEIGTKIA